MSRNPYVRFPKRIRSLGALLTILVLAESAHAQLLFTRERFDEMDRAIDAGRDLANATSDTFAWGESYMMRGYIEMYLATADDDYLRRLVRVADQIISGLDWSLNGHYTVAKLTLKDTAGRDAILLRSIRYAYNDKTVVEVRPGKQPGIFALSTSNEFWEQHGNASATFDGLSLDPASPRYFERIINDPAYIPSERFERSDDPEATASYLLVAEDVRTTGRTRQAPATTSLAPVGPTHLVPQVVQYYAYIGPILSSMTRFATLVRDRPGLQPAFGPAARRYIRAAREALELWEDCWRDGSEQDEGYYLLIKKGADFWCDGIMAPNNYMAAAGQVLLNVWDCTGDSTALDHARRIARLIKRSCIEMPNGSYSFPYWSPVGRRGWQKSERLSVNTPQFPPYPVADDLSHAAWTVEFAIMCQQRKIVFTRSDMRRFAKTFTKNLWTGDPPSLARRVDGTGSANGADTIAGAGWLDLCAFDSDIFTMNRTIWESNDHAKGAYGHLTGCYARMFRWQELLNDAHPRQSSAQRAGEVGAFGVARSLH